MPAAKLHRALQLAQLGIKTRLVIQRVLNW